jgi:hypothetical protein
MKYATCNFDKKKLHPQDAKAVEEFMAYRKDRAQKAKSNYVCPHGVIHNSVRYCKICLKESMK